MSNPFLDRSIQLYRINFRFKWLIVIIAAGISIASILYSNYLVNELKETEIRFINLYAKSLENAVNQDENITFLTQEIIAPNRTIPVILVDNFGNVVDQRNVIKDGWSPDRKNRVLTQEIGKMKREYEPIRIEFRDQATGDVYDTHFIYYRNSFLLTQLTYYPYIQLSVIAIFGIIAYLAFTYSKTAEQNKLWVGLAKETAHQLGTPLSSLMAWVEYLKSDSGRMNDPKEFANELNKDVLKLQTITERFSNIGSVPVLNEENITGQVNKAVHYLRTRISTKVRFDVSAVNENITAWVNPPLFEWVIENLCKNALDAMSGVGRIDIRILRGSDWRVYVDITDDGKGIPKSRIKQVFNPGFTTKKRGWGLGLTLAKRIIENYHKGRIFIKSSEPNKGTTFRIVLSARKVEI